MDKQSAAEVLRRAVDEFDNAEAERAVALLRAGGVLPAARVVVPNNTSVKVSKVDFENLGERHPHPEDRHVGCSGVVVGNHLEWTDSYDGGKSQYGEVEKDLPPGFEVNYGLLLYKVELSPDEILWFADYELEFLSSSQARKER